MAVQVVYHQAHPECTAMAEWLGSDPTFTVALGFALAGLIAFLVLRGRRNEGSDLSGVPSTWQSTATRAGPGTAPDPTPALRSPAMALPNTPPFNRLNPQQMETIAREIAAGNKISAIKLLREATGLDLKGSKDAIETLTR
jgi:hypothetical protein